MSSTAPTPALRIGWFVAGALAVVVASWGIADFSVYDGLIASDTRPGALSQDVITVPAGLALCALALAAGRSGPKRELVALGLLGYLFYAYGIYVIERMYNPLYLAYLAIFTVSFWSAVIGTVTLVRRLAGRPALPRRVRLVSAWGALLQPLVFYPLWIRMLVPIMARRDQIDSLYSIFILDLSFIMPAFLLVAVGGIRDRAWAVLLAPAMFVLGGALILSLALGELFKPAFGTPVAASALIPPVALTALFTVLALVHLRSLRLTDGAAATPKAPPAPVPARTGA